MEIREKSLDVLSAEERRFGPVQRGRKGLLQAVQCEPDESDPALTSAMNASR